MPEKGENITDSDYNHVKRVCNDFGEYHDLYLKIDALLLSDVFEDFRKMCLEIYQLALCLSFSSRVSMARSFKKY